MARPPSHSRNEPSDGALLDAIGSALLAVDTECRVIRVNAAAERLFGRRQARAVGRSCSELLRLFPCDGRCPFRRAMERGGPARFGALILPGPDGLPRTLDACASPLRGPGGRLLGATGTLREVGDEAGQVRLYGQRLFVSQTPAMRRIFDALPKLAQSRAPLLLVGRPGSGRAALAEVVHTISATSEGSPADHPLVTVNCAGLTEDNVPDLRGPGGLLRRAAGGTLLLQRICRAPRPLQRRLLAWIEEGEERPVRLMVTAGLDLAEAVSRGAFPKNLYYRLNVLHVALPDLRQRSADIPLLVEQFIDELNVRRGRQVEGLESAALCRLMEAEFSGNVRQLRRTVAEAHAHCRGPVIGLADLPALPTPRGAWKPWDEQERRRVAHLEQALRAAEGNISRAARALGMHRSTLWRQLRRYGLNR